MSQCLSMKHVGVVALSCQSIINITALEQNDPIFFASPISRVSCSTWDVEHPESDLKAANLPPWREDWQEMLDLGIDTFKLHGRESMMRLQESMDLIKRWADKDEYMFPEYKSIRNN